MADQGMLVPPHGETNHKPKQTLFPNRAHISALPILHHRHQHESLPCCAPGGKDMRIMDERKSEAAAE